MTSERLQAVQNLNLCAKLAENADHVLLQFTDLQGLHKGRTIPAEETANALAEGVTFDGSSVLAGVRIEESDMIMKPDASTFTVYPHYFYDKNVASLICDIQKPDGTQFESDPRHICRKAIEKAQRSGCEATAAAELEFYLVRGDSERGIYPVENHLHDEPRYFDNSPCRDLTEPYRMELADALSTMGIVIERQHHEVGSAQSEITFRYSDPITTADNILRYKFAAKAVADKRYGWIATFMPKPWKDKAGSGMHIHVGLADIRTGRNRFYDPDSYGYISQEGRYFVGGILEHAKALSAIAAPTVNSYKRLVPGYEAPVYISWSKRNRSALVRIPAFPSKNEREARIEFRCPDPLCNPYLVFATVLEAGLDGIARKVEPPEPVEANLYSLNENECRKLGVRVLPSSLGEALEEIKTDDICAKAMGQDNCEKYVELKLQECKDYEQHSLGNREEVTKWEAQRYLYS